MGSEWVGAGPGAGDPVGVPTGDRRGRGECSAPAVAPGSPLRAAGPGRRGPGAAQRRCRCCSCGRGRVAAVLRPTCGREPGRAAAAAPGVQPRRLQTRGKGLGCAATPANFEVPGCPIAPATVPATQAGVPTCPPPRSAKLVSLFPLVGASIFGAAGLDPSGLPRQARSASPREPAGRHPGGATLPAAPEQLRLLPATSGESRVMSGN